MKIKLKDLIKESVLGEMPSDKLMKMKWNPVTEDEAFEPGDVFGGGGGGNSETETPTGNMAIKKFDALVGEKTNWSNVRKLTSKLSDMKQMEFALHLLKDLALSDKAKAKLKLKLGSN